MDRAVITSVREKAELLYGESLGQRGDALAELACQRACAHCNRSDIPDAMEQAVAAIAVAMAQGEGVTQLKRGDTAMTFAASDPMALLAPFCRLASVHKEERE